MSATLTPGGNALTLQVANPGRDDLVGMLVWCSTASGFVPGPANLVYSGPDLVLQIIGLSAGVPHYVRYAFVSEIDPADYDVSAELTATPVAAAEAGANKTYVDGTGKIQGVSLGAGTAVSNTNIALSADGTLTGAGASSQVSLTSIPGILQASHLQALTMAAGSSITAGTVSDGVKLDAAGKCLIVSSGGVERVRLGYGVGPGAAYGLQVKSSTGKVMLDTADGVLIRGDIVQDNYSIGDSTTGGVDAMFGFHNLAVGTNALATPNASKWESVAIGTDALRNATTGSYNNALGHYSLKRLTTGGFNVGICSSAGTAVTASSFNVALGSFALSDTNEVLVGVGSGNVAVGSMAMQDAAGNMCAWTTAVGYRAGQGMIGGWNTVVGFEAGIGMTNHENTIIGASAGKIGDTGDRKVLIGFGAGRNLPVDARGVVMLGCNDGAGAANNTLILSDGDGSIIATGSAATGFKIPGALNVDGEVKRGYAGDLPLPVSFSTALANGYKTVGRGAETSFCAVAHSFGSSLHAANFNGYRASGAPGAFGIVANNMLLAQFGAFGHDGTAFQPGGGWRFFVDGVPTAGSMPTRAVLQTTPAGSVVPVDRMAVNNAGDAVWFGPLSATSLLASGAGIGYSTGAGGAVTQLTSKATAVTLNKACGRVTMSAAALAANTAVSFTLTNSAIAASDVVQVNIASGATAGAYLVLVDAVAAGSCRVSLRNLTAASLAEALVLNFAVIKAVGA